MILSKQHGGTITVYTSYCAPGGSIIVNTYYREPGEISSRPFGKVRVKNEKGQSLLLGYRLNDLRVVMTLIERCFLQQACRK